nr:proline-rich protein 4 [Quercus suber]
MGKGYPADILKGLEANSKEQVLQGLEGYEKEVEVVGFSMGCSGILENKLGMKGLRVTFDCKPENGHFKTRGVGKLDEEGKFKVSVHRKIVKDGKLNEECYA